MFLLRVSESASHAAWRSFFSGVPMQGGNHIFRFCNTSAVKRSILASSVRITFPCCVALVLFWRPHNAWGSIFSLLHHLCSENDILGETALLVASCTLEAPSALLRAFVTPSDVLTAVESIVDVLFSAVLWNFHDAYEEFVNTLESIVGWYAYNIVMIRVFFRRGEVQGLPVFASVPPQFSGQLFFLGAQVALLADYQLQLAELASSSWTNFLPFSKNCDFCSLCCVLRAHLHVTIFLTLCVGPIFFHFCN